MCNLFQVTLHICRFGQKMYVCVYDGLNHFHHQRPMSPSQDDSASSIDLKEYAAMQGQVNGLDFSQLAMLHG